jgi:predicted nucleic acid-binding protein
VALAQKADAKYIVSGDAHLTQLTDPSPPVLTPRESLKPGSDHRCLRAVVLPVVLQ